MSLRQSSLQLHHCSLLLAALFGVVGITVGGPVEDAKKSDHGTVTFADHVLPIFRSKCLRCHAGVEPKGGLNLASPNALLSGGDSGPAIRVAAAEFSLLYERVAADEMPAVGQKLTAEEKGLIRKWINDGAAGVDPSTAVGSSNPDEPVEFWSFNPPRRPDLPTVHQSSKVRNPLDTFVLQQLEEHDLTLAAEASKEVLLRRASFDLTGIPPTPQELQDFLADQRPDAWERLLDRLLDSPHYGERWGRHWLDVAGYADSAGILNEDRQLPLMWKYRDYVIRSFNSDKPYDQFLREQIAGDELADYWSVHATQEEMPDSVIESITATGFLRTAADASRPDFSTIKNAHSQYYFPTMFDTLQIISSSTMGLTIQCARCHSHKFDPIPQTDYFRMQAVLMGAYRPDNWVPQMERRLKTATAAQQRTAADRNKQIDEAVKMLESDQADLLQTAAAKLFAARLAELPQADREAVETAFAVAEDQRSDAQKALVEHHQKQLQPDGEELKTALAETNAEWKQQSDDIAAQIAAQNGQRIVIDEVRALYDLEGNTTARLLLRGDPLTPGPEVQPGVLSAVNAPEDFQWTAPDDGARSSGRRLAFAKWLTQPQHPLTARVMVNRIWMHHFGRGIVGTPEDFGIAGEPPTHPELLDWLATEFVRSGWSVKHIHRLILNSSVWRQASQLPAAEYERCQTVDPENSLYWRQNIRRLDAEPMRDAFLFVSGSADPTLYGPPVPVNRAGNGEVSVPAGHGENRRSIYVLVMRLKHETMLDLFDQPKISVNCTHRSISTVSTQALTLLNSDFLVRAAKNFAARVKAEGDEDPLDYAVQAAFSRSSDKAEHQFLTEFLADQTARHLAIMDENQRADQQSLDQARHAALTDLCHMLLSSNEFAYVD